jgi:hypothetical protein
MEFRENLEPFLDSLNQCILTKNWYGALMIAVTLPDICVSVDGTQESERQRLFQKKENTNGASKNAYINWFNEYCNDWSRFGFMNGKNAYALRCAVLHQGDSDIKTQKAVDLNLGYEKIQFVLSDGSRKGKMVIQNQVLWSDPSIELNKEEKVLNVEVESFCGKIYHCVSIWMERQLYHESQRVEKILDTNSDKLFKIKTY